MVEFNQLTYAIIIFGLPTLIFCTYFIVTVIENGICILCRNITKDEPFGLNNVHFIFLPIFISCRHFGASPSSAQYSSIAAILSSFSLMKVSPSNSAIFSIKTLCANCVIMKLCSIQDNLCRTAIKPSCSNRNSIIGILIANQTNINI